MDNVWLITRLPVTTPEFYYCLFLQPVSYCVSYL